ncbi:MAG: hypothetical protein ACK2T5_07930, partial [Anaerolineales bacterium]
GKGRIFRIEKGDNKLWLGVIFRHVRTFKWSLRVFAAKVYCLISCMMRNQNPAKQPAVNASSKNRTASGGMRMAR